MSKNKSTNELRVRLIKSVNGHTKHTRLCVKGLGLRKINKTVIREDTPAIRGLINHVSFLLHVEAN